jgi:uncharacterized protein YoaH (UPF0181 family)
MISSRLALLFLSHRQQTHNTMIWNDTHFPAAMRSLNPSTRQKAIEIANRLVAQGELSKQQAITASIAEARRIARLSSSISEGNRSYVTPRQ